MLKLNINDLFSLLRYDEAYANKGASMTFGQQPGNGDPYYGGNQQQPAYGQQQYGQSQYSYAPNGTAAINAQTIYSREQVQAAQRASVTRAYGEMTLGLIITPSSRSSRR